MIILQHFGSVVAGIKTIVILAEEASQVSGEEDFEVTIKNYDRLRDNALQSDNKSGWKQVKGEGYTD